LVRQLPPKITIPDPNGLGPLGLLITNFFNKFFDQKSEQQNALIFGPSPNDIILINEIDFVGAFAGVFGNDYDEGIIGMSEQIG
jgi:hypothetical protein